MIFAKIRFNNPGYTESVVYKKAQFETLKRLFDISVLFELPFEIHGSSYKERKESLRELAIDFQLNNDGETDVQLGYSEIGAAAEFFERAGRRYGLLREFRENCIC